MRPEIQSVKLGFVISWNPAFRKENVGDRQPLPSL